MRGDILLLTGVLLLILCSESAFCDVDLDAGYNRYGSGIITIGYIHAEFANESGTVTLNGDVSLIKSNEDKLNDIKLGNYTEGNGAAIFAAGHTIDLITIDRADLDPSAAGTLTIYGGADATADGVVNITGEISTGSAGIKILATGAATSGAIRVDGAIDSSYYGGGGAVTVSTTGSGTITVGHIYTYASSGGGGAVTVSTTGSGAITVGGDINSYSAAGAGGDVTVSTDGGAITVVGNIVSNSLDDYNNYNGGAVTVSTTGSGEISVGDISCSSFGNSGAVKVLAANGKIKSLGNIQTNNGTVTIEAGELNCNIGTIGTSSYKSGQVDITIGSVTSSTSGTIGNILTNGANVNITAGNGLNLSSINAGSGSINLTANNGTFTLSGATTCSALNIAVSKGATFINNTGTGSVIDLSGDKGSLTLDFGDASATSTYAKTTGAFKSSGTTEVTSIYGINGFAGRTYAAVFNTQVVDENGDPYADGIELNNTKDTYRKYILANNGNDIIVKNNNSIRQDIIDLGGSQQAAAAANNLIDNQGNFDSEGQAFVDQFTALIPEATAAQLLLPQLAAVVTRHLCQVLRPIEATGVRVLPL